ncbi:MAG: hypothetical protein ACHQ50_12845 [Fimbriimonadales bacterium]
MNPRSILVLGGPKAGKTHYGAQLLFRLEQHKGGLRFYEPPENVEPFREAMHCISQGRAAGHTPLNISQEVVLPVEFSDGQRAKLVWPEYGGEQVNELLATRHAKPAWVERARESQGWLLLARHDLFNATRDLLDRPVDVWMSARQNPEGADAPWMFQSQVVELLQMLLFLRRSASSVPRSEPRLVVAISCWDDLQGREKFASPAHALRAVAPLVASFVEANWVQEARVTIGLSSLGKNLSETQEDEEFVNCGPHQQGFVVLPDGQIQTDLTWPLVELLAK